jgi:hypothetical protein
MGEGNSVGQENENARATLARSDAGKGLISCYGD